jgi:pimeloyl-ACP methyl ester carboxylesterase
MEPYTKISEFVDLTLSALVRHGYVIHCPFDDDATSQAGGTHATTNASTSAASKASSGSKRVDLSNTPPLTLMGHNYGCLIAFELAREFEKPNSTTLVNFHKLIVSSGRPPQVQWHTSHHDSVV